MQRDFTPTAVLAERATAFVTADPPRQPVAPRASATVLLLREPDPATGVDEGPEVFVLRRAASMAFAARMHAFPGGGVDPRDADLDVPWAGPTPAEWGAVLGAGEREAAELVCAAVRELFEECGVLLAGPDAGSVVDDLSDPQWEVDRQALLDRSLAMSALLARRGLVLRSDLLRGWAHWTTPLFEARRYDTRFFVAALPAGQRARDVGGEADHAAWISAAASVRGFEAGALAMLPPTIIALEEVAACRSVAEVLATPRALARVMPWLVPAGSGTGDFVLRTEVDGRGGGGVGPASGFEATP